MKDCRKVCASLSVGVGYMVFLDSGCCRGSGIKTARIVLIVRSNSNNIPTRV